MVKIITNSQLQKSAGKISKNLQSAKKPLIVTTHGQPQMFCVPFFEDGYEFLEEYFENYEIHKNKKKLQKKWKKSAASGEGNLKI